MKKKKKKKLISLQIRKEWEINPVSRIKESKKIYSRKNKKVEIEENE